MSIIEQLMSSLKTSFVNYSNTSMDSFKPKLLINDDQTFVLSSLLKELETCQSFKISVAFITTGGLTMLKAALADLARKNVKGQILTSTYLSFNHPTVFKQLLKIPNIDVRLTDIEGFHAKGYIFKQQSYQTLIIGSSNLTESALKTNYEWNVKLNSLNDGELLQRFEQQFQHVWQKSMPLSSQWVMQYEQQYKLAQPDVQFAKQPTLYNIKQQITPNKMQQQALAQIQQVRLSGEKRALVISATGTGKTYLAAFDVQQAKPKKMLFVVHREQILKKAMEDFREILQEPAENFGLFVGSTQQIDCQYVFATVQTLSKTSNLSKLNKDLFDYILIDEVHKAGASSYLKVLKYFKPAFLLGMTATPERSDQFNLFELFDYNIAYEIRLQQALEENMLCPFHYFGVVEYCNQRDTNDELTLQQLMMEERVDYILEKIDYYGFSGACVKGLVFCSRKEEANILSKEFNRKGYRTAALTGDIAIIDREKTIQQLENGQLDYIFTVDIFNEGIDIPMVNQIIMLRQTQSSIIFIQQLGRGLRKHPTKEYVTILDFIGNYKNNYMIPMALSGDNSFNKDTLQKHVMEPIYIKGISSIHFEEIAKKRIFEAIKVKSLVDLKMVKDSYKELKNRLGRSPLLTDFVKHNFVDPQVILRKKPNYYELEQAVFKSDAHLTETEGALLTFVSQELINGKRLHEILLLKLLMYKPSIQRQQWSQLLQQCELSSDELTLQSVENILTLHFYTQPTRTKYQHISLLLMQDEQYTLSTELQQALKNPIFQYYFNDVLHCALLKSEAYQLTQLTRNAKYSRKDYCRLMNWRSDMTSTIYGYKIDDATKTCPLFITYHKDEDIHAEILYEDELINLHELKWFTRPNMTITSKEVHQLLHDEALLVHVFIKKDGAEGTDFYYLGEVKPKKGTAMNLQKNNKSIVSMHFQFDEEINETIFRYLTI